MKLPIKTISLFASASLLISSSLSANVTTDPVGYTTTVLPAGSGNLFAPAFVESNSAMGSLTGAVAGNDSTLTVSVDLPDGFFDRSVSVPGVSKGYPLYYLEILDDTDPDSAIDTEGLILDIISNTTSSVVVAANIDELGIQGNESFAIRKHLTLGSLFSNSSGLSAFTDAITIYNEDGAGTTVSHLPNGSGGFVLGSDFTTDSSDAPIYPGSGFVLNNINPITITPVGTVKQTDTQVVIYGGSAVNIVSVLKPIDNVDLSSDGRLNEALAAFTDAVNIYSVDGTLLPVTGFLSDGAGGFVDSSDFVTPVSAVLDGSSQPVVVNTATDTVYKVSGVVIP